MTKLLRWDNGETIHEHDGDIRATVEAAAKLGISCFRASLVGAILVGASLVGASLVGARLVSASLVGASLDRASLDGASLDRASLVGARLPIWCRWPVTFQTKPRVVVSIGCKSMPIADWDSWFAGSEEFDTPRSDDRFLQIRANYLAVRAYLEALGHVPDNSSAVVAPGED